MRPAADSATGHRAARLLALLSLALLLSTLGCAAGQVNLWPLYFRGTRQVQTPEGRRQVTTTEVAYPFFSHESSPDGSWHALRPLYNYQASPEPGHYRVQYLWPLGLHFKDGRKVTEHRLFPLFGYIKHWSPLTERYGVHAHLIQLIRWGTDDCAGPYFALFPLAGVTHGVIADTWSFVLFPLYSHYRHGDYVRNDLPWPILGSGSTPEGQKKMFRFWPFYVQKRKDTPTELRTRYDVLWPVVRWGMLDRRGRYYHTVTAVTPFYSAVKTWDREGNLVSGVTSVLGFAFGVGQAEEPETGGWSALWSMVRNTRKQKADDFRIMPLYWRTTYYRDKEGHPERRWTRRRAPWPVVWVDTDTRDPAHGKSSVVVAPLYWHFTDSYRDADGGEQRESRVTLWPLITWERGRDGDVHLWVASRGWRDPGQGYKRNYRAFFDLFQYHRQADGERETRLVWRLYHHRRGPKGRYWSLASLLTYDSTDEVPGEEGAYVSALFGLVKCSWSDLGHRWRIFYVPVTGG